MPVPEGWDDRPTAYLAFGDTYREEREEAERRGWPVATVSGEHLQLVNDSALVADKIVDLMGRLGIRSSPC